MKRIRDIIESPECPSNPNVLWLDTSNPNNPVLKSNTSGMWESTNSDSSSSSQNKNVINLETLYDYASYCQLIDAVNNDTILNTIIEFKESPEDPVSRKSSIICFDGYFNSVLFISEGEVSDIKLENTKTQYEGLAAIQKSAGYCSMIALDLGYVSDEDETKYLFDHMSEGFICVDNKLLAATETNNNGRIMLLNTKSEEKEEGDKKDGTKISPIAQDRYLETLTISDVDAPEDLYVINISWEDAQKLIGVKLGE